MKKLFIVVITIILLVAGCGKKESDVYPDTTLKDFKTFTAITGTELNIVMDNDEETVLYNYLLDNNASGLGAVTKYEKYIQDYGFEKLEEYSSDAMTAYIYDDHLLYTSMQYPQDNVIQYVVGVPRRKITETGAELQGQQVTADADMDGLYEEIVSLVKNESFQEAYDLWWNSPLSEDFEGYKDSKQYMFLSQAMLYDQNGGYGNALDMLIRDCPDLTDLTKGYIDRIRNEVTIPNGTYTVTFDGVTRYIFVLDGKIDMESELEGRAHKTSSYYTDSIVKVVWSTGETTIGIGSMAGFDSEPKANYAFTVLSPDSFLCAAIEGTGGDSFFSGVYNKESDSTPTRKTVGD